MEVRMSLSLAAARYPSRCWFKRCRWGQPRRKLLDVIPDLIRRCGSLHVIPIPSLATWVTSNNKQALPQLSPALPTMEANAEREKVAVIGSGLAGLVSANLLVNDTRRRYAVHIFESVWAHADRRRRVARAIVLTTCCRARRFLWTQPLSPFRMPPTSHQTALTCPCAPLREGTTTT